MRGLLVVGALAACGDGGGGAPEPSRIEVTPASTALAPQEIERLTARVVDDSGAPIAGAAVAWATSDPQVALVASGLVTAIAEGSATITATATGTQLVGSATVTVGAGPAARWAHALAWDGARQEVVLFGGGNATGFLGDTWAWNGTAWRRIEVAGPSPRDQAVMAFDEARARLVLFGGRLLTDTWEWDGARWEEKATSGPRAREHHSSGYDRARARVILFGGLAEGGAVLDDTWAWEGASWTRVATSVPVADRWPPSRGMVFSDPRGRLLVMVGDLAQDASDLWEWNGAAWSAIPAGRAPIEAPAIVAETGVPGEVLAVNEAPAGSSTLHTWHWDGQAWTRLSTTGPPARFVTAMAYDAARGEVVLFGGAGPENPSIGRYRGDTWVWRDGAWTRR